MERGLHVGALREHVDVIVVDVRHDGDDGAEGQKRAIVLVGLDHQMFAAPGVGVRAQIDELAAAEERRIQTAGAQRAEDQPRRRGLAVRTRDGDDLLPACQKGPGVLAAPDRNARLARGNDLRVAHLIGRGTDDDVRAADIASVEVADDRATGLGHKLRQRPIRRRVRTRDVVSAGEQELRDGAHTSAADADDVEPH